MNQDWTLRGGNQKSPETAKLQGHLALTRSTCLGIRRDTAEPDSWVESTSTPPLHSWPVWLSTSELTISSARIHFEQPLELSKFVFTVACVRNTHYHFTTPSFEIEGYCNPKLWDEVIDTIRLIRKISEQQENTQKPKSDLSPCGMKHSKIQINPCWMKQSMARLKLCFENSEVSTLHGCVVRPLQSENTLLSLRECYMVAVILLLLPSCHAIPFCCWPLQHCQTLRLTPNQAEVARDSSGFWKQTVGASIAVKSLRIFSVSPPRCTPNN